MELELIHHPLYGTIKDYLDILVDTEVPLEQLQYSKRSSRVAEGNAARNALARAQRMVQISLPLL